MSRSRKKEDLESKALSSYGVVFEKAEERRTLLRFAEDRPVSQVTTKLLAWVVDHLAAWGKRVWVLVWDNASWHISQEVRGWIRSHNAAVKRKGGIRILTCELPVRSPWLNPIEPMWLHRKRAIAEPDGELAAWM